MSLVDVVAAATAQYEYKELEVYYYPTAEDLNKLGADGWMLCAVAVDREPPVRFYFVRPRPISEIKPS